MSITDSIVTKGYFLPCKQQGPSGLGWLSINQEQVACYEIMLLEKKTTNKLQLTLHSLNPLTSELFTKQTCRDAVVVYSLFLFSNNIYFALLICIEHCFTKIELYTLHIYIYIFFFSFLC